MKTLESGSTQSVEAASIEVAEKSDASTKTVVLRNDAKAQSTFIMKDMKDGDTMSHSHLMSPYVILSNRKNSKFFTGLFPDQCEALFKFLGPAKYQPTYWRTPHMKNDNSYKYKATRNRKFNEKEELFFTLLKLRRGFTHQTIAYMYDVSVNLISSIITTRI